MFAHRTSRAVFTALLTVVACRYQIDALVSADEYNNDVSALVRDSSVNNIQDHQFIKDEATNSINGDEFDSEYNDELDSNDDSVSQINSLPIAQPHRARIVSSRANPHRSNPRLGKQNNISAKRIPKQKSESYSPQSPPRQLIHRQTKDFKSKTKLRLTTIKKIIRTKAKMMTAIWTSNCFNS
jgi:hypothetical protein